MSDEEAEAIRARREAAIEARTEVATAMQLLRSAVARLTNVGLGTHATSVVVGDAARRSEVASILMEQLVARLP